MNSRKGVVVIEGHVQGLANTRLLGKYGIPVIVLDKDNCVARYSRYCNKYFKCPDYLSDDFVEYIIRLHKAENLQGWLLLPSNDHAVLTISRHKERLNHYYQVITEDLDVINNIYNKRVLLTIAHDAGLPIPKTVMPRSSNPLEVDLRYPIIIKGNNGLSFYKKYHQKAIVLEKERELPLVWNERLHGAEPEEYFIQEVIPNHNKTVSVTVFSVNGEVYSYWMGAKLREHPISFGTATCCQSMFDEEMLDYSRILIKKLRYTGVCEIEWLRDSRDNKPKLIEINARTWLWVGLAAKCGVNYPKLLYDYVNTKKIPKFAGYEKSKIWLNLYTDLVYSVKSMMHGMERPKNIAKTYHRFTEACWDWKDPIPFFAYAALITHYLNKR